MTGLLKKLHKQFFNMCLGVNCPFADQPVKWVSYSKALRMEQNYQFATRLSHEQNLTDD